MKLLTRLTLLVLACAGAPLAVHAQNGCVNSPENPTAVLALVGIAAVALRNRNR